MTAITVLFNSKWKRVFVHNDGSSSQELYQYHFLPFTDKEIEMIKLLTLSHADFFDDGRYGEGNYPFLMALKMKITNLLNP